MADRARTQTRISKESEHQTSWLSFVLKILVAIVTAPYRRTFKLYTWRPLKDIRAADRDRKVLIAMVKDWKVEKYAELHSVQVAASFCTGVTLATISWPKVTNPIWVTDALWFCSLICSIWAVITSIQTKSILDDLPDQDQLTPSLPDVEVKRMRQVILRYKKTPGIEHWIMLFIWQFPSMTMSYAWTTFLSGLTVYVCTPFIRNMEWENWHKIAIVYLAVGSVGLLTYLFSSLFVYLGEKDSERSAASTGINTDDIESTIGLVSANAQTGMKRRQQASSSAEGPVYSARVRSLYDGEIVGELRRESQNSKRQLLI